MSTIHLYPASKGRWTNGQRDRSLHAWSMLVRLDGATITLHMNEKRAKAALAKEQQPEA